MFDVVDEVEWVRGAGLWISVLAGWIRKGYVYQAGAFAGFYALPR